MTHHVLRVDRLCISDTQGNARLRDVTLSLNAGESLVVMGCSGAGKSTLGRALLGELDAGMHYNTGQILCCGTAVHCASKKQLALLRRQHTAWLGQDPATELTPTMKVENLLSELALSADQRIPTLLREFGLPDDATFTQRFPHQLSGGQRRRVALIRLLVKQPRLLILDEPFAGLDKQSRRQMRSALHRLRCEQGCALVLISHDVSGLRHMATQMLVLDQGCQVEYGPSQRLCVQPTSAILRQFLQKTLSSTAIRTGRAVSPVLQVENLTLRTALTPPGLPSLSFQLHAGECLALSGTSGVGKSSLVRALMGLEPGTAGEVRLRNRILAPRVAQRQPHEQQALGWVPQDPGGSLNPFRSIGEQLRQARDRFTPRSRYSAAQWLARVGLSAVLLDRLPGQLSGGEQQRVALARALVGQPQVLICDEVTSALDVVTARHILRLLKQLSQEEGLALLLITHDVRSAREICPRVLHLSPQTGIIPLLNPQQGDDVDDGYHRPSAVKK